MKVSKIVGTGLAVLILAGLGFYAWAATGAKGKLSRTYVTHTVEFPIPFPLSPEEVGRERLTAETADHLARARALERGKHLIQSRYACGECHGRDFSGGVMIDDAAIGRLLGPNLTGGAGGRTAGFRSADWDRIVRHGVKPDGTPALMPSVDFQQMSDQELSDIVFYIRSQPSVDHLVPAPKLGPLGKILVATGNFTLSADLIGSHVTPHPPTPPEPAPTVVFGRHLANTCTGCHRADLGGGPIVGGDPSWPPAANLTQDTSGVHGWTFAQFETAMREGKRPDGGMLRAPMSSVVRYAKNMTGVEMEALWNYLRSLPPVSNRK
ncbi:MAG TPA: cytochrome c [Gemmatimonadales bacterium]|nr:cytochrome c [Gemmatimonadales bacterium]